MQSTVSQIYVENWFSTSIVFSNIHRSKGEIFNWTSFSWMFSCVFLVAQRVSHLLGVNSQHFANALLRPKLKVGREMVTKAQNKTQVVNTLEACAKATYEKLFKWILSRINKSLDRNKRQGVSFIGILDIAGFEIFQVSTASFVCVLYASKYSAYPNDGT